MRTKELRQKRAAIFENTIKPIFAAAQTENRAITSEEQEKITRAEAEMDAIKATYEGEERAASIERELNESVKPPNKPEVRTETPATETRASRLASVGYASAFRSWILSGVQGLTGEERDVLLPELRAQGVGTAGAGGATVPTGFRAKLMEAMKAFGGVREAGVTVLNTDAGNDLPIPTVNDTSQTGELVAENVAVTPQDATFSSVVLKAYKYSSKSILVSFELLQDSAINIDGYVASALGTRLARIQNTHFTTGDNASKPQGVVVASTLGKTAASATAITYLELIDLMHSVDPAHRRNARWMLNDLTLAALKKLQDTQGRPLWMPGIAVGEPDTFLGKPYVINQDMATIATTARTILFGDFSYYHVRDVMDVQLYRITDKYIEQGSVGFLAYMRADGRLVNPGSNPIKHLVQA